MLETISFRILLVFPLCGTKHPHKGFKKPSTGFPAAISLSFTKLIALANIGLDALVPDSIAAFPFTIIGIFSP